MTSRALLLATAVASLAAGAEPDGPVASGYGLGFCLEARDKPQPSLWLALRYHLVPYGWGRMTDYGILPLGEIRAPGASQAVAVAAADRVSRTHRIGGQGAVKVTVSRLTPALLVELEGTSVSLFAGDRGWWTHPQYLAEWRKRVPVSAPRAPRSYAVSDGQSVRCGTLTSEGVTLAGAEKGWLLLWFGQDTWFHSGNTVMEPAKVVPGDAPTLFVFSQPPTLKLAGDDGQGAGGGIVLSFPQPGAKFALLPLYGYRFPAARETQAWAKELPEAMRKRCDEWAARLAEFPTGLNESISADAGADTATIKWSFTHTSIRPGGTRCAPIPPVLELARAEGFPITLSATPADTELFTYCGPYGVVEGAAAVSATIKGTAKYALEALSVKPLPEGAAAVQAELVAGVDKVLAAGHLAPVNLPWKVSYGWGAFHFSSARHLYSAPGQTLSTLARALPFLDPERRAKVLAYLQRERADFPPESIAHLPSDVGARREPWALSEGFIKAETNKLRAQNFHVRTKTIPPQALYDLWSYYAAVGFDKMAADGFTPAEAARRSIEPWLQRGEWATLGWLSWPLDQRDPQYYGSYGWNQAADANRLAVGLIGLARLARAAKDKALEERALAHLARTLAHRFAAGRYASWLYKQRDILPAPDGFSPADDPREAAISESHAVLGYGRNQHGPLPYFSDEEGPYVAMSPELARFFADHLKPQAESFARATAAYYPDAFLTLGTPRRCAEWWHNYPQDSHQIFLVHAWTLGKDGDWLRRHLDVPLTPVGDWYHLDKLVAALQAYRKAEWQDPVSRP